MVLDITVQVLVSYVRVYDSNVSRDLAVRCGGIWRATPTLRQGRVTHHVARFTVLPSQLKFCVKALGTRLGIEGQAPSID